MLNDKIAKLINEQVNKELYSAYLYLDFANYYEQEGLDGFVQDPGAGRARPCHDDAQVSDRQRDPRYVRRNRAARQSAYGAFRALKGGLRARAVRHLAYQQHLRRSVRAERF